MILVPDNGIHVKRYDLLISFQEIVLLFSSLSHIVITERNFYAFSYLAEILQNQALNKICQSFSLPQSFYLTSQLFSQLSTDIFCLLNDFTIKLKKDNIKCNSIFAALISNKIFKFLKENPNHTLIDFSHFNDSKTLQEIFNLLKGYPIQIHLFKKELLLKGISFLECLPLNSLILNEKILTEIPIVDFAAQKFSLLPYQNITCLPAELIEQIISSPYLHILNEDYLFSVVFQKIFLNQSNMFLLKYVFGGLVNMIKIEKLINSFHVHNDVFLFLKHIFKYNFLINSKERVNFLLSYSNILFEIYSIEKENFQTSAFLEQYQEIKEYPLSSIVIQGMKILRDNSKNGEIQQEAASIFKNAADKGDIEASWRIAACYRQGIGVAKNWDFARFYAKKSMEAGSIDGTFWYGLSCKSKEDKFLFLKKASKKGHIAAKWFSGFCLYNGDGTTKNVEEAKDKIRSVGMSGDGYWSNIFSIILQQGKYGFNKDEKQAESLKQLSKNQPQSDCTIFFLSN